MRGRVSAPRKAVLRMPIVPFDVEQKVDATELLAWIAIAHGSGRSRAHWRLCLERTGSASALGCLLRQRHPLIWRPSDLPPLTTSLDELQRCTDRFLDWQQSGPHRQLLPLDSPFYPQQLLHAPDPPLVLHAIGCAAVLENPIGVAIVGSRRPSPLGKHLAFEFGASIAGAGGVVISGLALGIDGSAHWGALSAPGLTCAVLAHGLDHLYPHEHTDLALQISEHGLLISEFNLGVPPQRHHFPIRNRIIAGLAQHVVVVEASLKSGTLITARLAIEANREVLVVPGPVNSRQHEGCLELIRQGACLIRHSADLLQEVGVSDGAPASDQSDGTAPPKPLELQPVEVPTVEAEAFGSASASAAASHQDVPPAAFNSAADSTALRGVFNERGPRACTTHQGSDPAASQRTASLNQEQLVWLERLLAPGPLHLEEILEQSDCTHGALQELLLEAEICRVIARSHDERIHWITAEMRGTPRV